MIGISLIAWGWFAILLILSSLAGIAISRFFPWSTKACDAGFPGIAGLGLAPFLSGLCTVFALWIAPGMQPMVHIGMVFGILILVYVTTRLYFKTNVERRKPQRPFSKFEKVFLVLLAISACGLLINTLLIPLTQNDALEYATVGRLLFEIRDIKAYPAINTEIGQSGFYGPWTHPPVYPALIYLTYAFQNSADMPGLMRMISPWFALTATLLIFALGNHYRRLVGLMAATLFLPIPLFFLGSDSALIDSLPVAGFCLVLMSVIGIHGSAWMTGIVRGGVLGIAMCTHSQAILLIPLTFVAVVIIDGWRNWNQVVRCIVGMTLAATIVGAWPYINNYFIFGSPISDNPAVFALPELAWPDYFRFARGIDNWAAIIQYGWLKGWFALEAYGIIFWLMLIGAIWYLKQYGLPVDWKSIRRGDSFRSTDHSILLLSMVLIICYLCGVVLSTLIGLDLMIRNERYMLLILPSVAIVSAYGVVAVYHGSKATIQQGKSFSMKSTARWLGLAAMPVIAVLSFSQLCFLVSYRTSANTLNFNCQTKEDSSIFISRPEYRVVRYIRKNTPPDDIILSLKPADLFYSERKMISYLDPRLLAFYREDNPEAGWRFLRKLGVRYVHLPDYYLPPIYNSCLQKILRQPELASLIYTADGNQLYALKSSDLIEGSSIPISPEVMPWTRTTNLILGGRKAFMQLTLAKKQLSDAEWSDANIPFSVLHRDISTSLVSGNIELDERAGEGDGATRPSEYGIDLNLRGQGFIRIWLLQFDENGDPIRGQCYKCRHRFLIGDVVLSPEKQQLIFSKRFQALSDAHSIRIELEHVGSSRLLIENARLVKLNNNSV